MEFTREEYENLPARSINDFKDFVLRRFIDYTKQGLTITAGFRSLEDKQTSIVERQQTIRDKGGWGGWTLGDVTMLDDSADFFVIYHYLQDERAPTSYYNFVKLPKDFVFREKSGDPQYQEYLRLKSIYEEN